MREADACNVENIHYFDNETRQIIGAVTYIVTAHFDDKRENLKSKINRLICNEVSLSVQVVNWT